MFDEQDKFPNNFKDSFLKHNNNKERLNLFLADKFSKDHQGEIKLTITKGTGILTNDDTSPLIHSSVIILQKKQTKSWFAICCNV